MRLFLQMLRECMQTKIEKKKGGYRYTNSLKLFATYLYMIGGRMLYETLSANLPLPSLSIMSRTINNNDDPIIEGTC